MNNYSAYLPRPFIPGKAMSVSVVKVTGPDGDGDGDGDGVGLTLPVVLGRGSLLKCGDKKVSRRHAYLDWEDKGVLITAVHQSPTYAVQGKGEVQMVTEGNSLLLTHGDKFGLLRDKFWYRVRLSTSLIAEETEPGNPSEKVKEEEREVEGEEDEEVNKGKEQVIEEEESNENIKSCDDVNDEVISSGEGKKVTTTAKDITGGRNSDPEESQGNIARTELDPQEQERAKGDEGAIEKHSNSSPSSSSSAPPISVSTSLSSPMTVTREELLSATSKKERKLPSWLQYTNGSSPAPPSTPSPKPVRSQKKQAKIRRPSPRKNASPSSITSTPVQFESDENLFSLETTSRRCRDASSQRSKITTATQNSPQQREDTESSPGKRGGGEEEGGGGFKQQISDSEEEDIAVTTTTILPFASPHPAKRRKAEEEEEVGEGTSTKVRKRAFPTATSNLSPTPNPSSSSRPSCQYGANCYRKNPVHREEEAHPGDTDYRSEGEGDSEEEEDRPQCEYGVDCYRKNPQHRRDFKHSRVPQPQRQAKRKAHQQKGRKNTAAGSEEDDYDFDDPFLNDGSSDDYAPTDDSSDSAVEPSQDGVEEEDTKRMLKEARKFVKKRK